MSLVSLAVMLLAVLNRTVGWAVMLLAVGSLGRVVIRDQRHKYRKLTIRNSHDSDDDFRSGCRIVGQCHQQQSFSGLLSPGRSNQTNEIPFDDK